MKRFMRGGKECSPTRGRGGGRSGVSITQLTHAVKEEASIKASTTPTADIGATHATPTQQARHSVTSQGPSQTTAILEARQVAAKHAAAKQEAARHATQLAAAKQKTAAQLAAAKQKTAAQLTAARQAAASQEAARQGATRHEAGEQAAEAQVEAEGMQVNVEEQLADHASSGKIELIPNVFWFSKSTVVAGVTDSFKAHYNFPYMSWTEVPQTVRDRWFLEFQRNFTWKPEYDDMVRRDYEKKGVERLKDLVNKASKVPLHKPVKWMSELLRADFVRKREDPDFVKRSTRAKKNRFSNQSEESFDPGHRQGSVSTVEVAERLAAKKDGVLPLAADVYEKTHGFEMPGGDTFLIGDRPNKIMAEYQEKLDDYKNKGVSKAPDDVFLEVVGGVKKGKVYGLGNASSMFYEASNPSQTKQSTHSVSLISQLSSQLEECKKMVEESKKVAEDSKKIAEDSLKIAKANQEAYMKAQSEWKKEKEELVTDMAKVKKAAAEAFQALLKERSFKPSS